ncbi:serine/threonine-protein kinase [Azospirillum doebereinerae]
MLSHTYLVEGLIARGGMGEVHRARHVDLNTWHAVKVIRPELVQDAKMVELLRREASALRDIRHEAVVAYDGVFRDEFGRLLLSMEYLDGPSLHEVLKGGPLPPDEVALLLDRVASGLAAAHQRGIIHRDMSTDNVILPGRRVADATIIDFGIAKQTAPEAGTVIGDAFAGKYGYAAPEQLGLFGGGTGPQSDIYSAGLVLAAAALGRPLDMGRTPQAMIERRMSVPDLGAVAEPLRGVLESMLAPDPKDRVKTMAELVGALTRPSAITPFDATPFPAKPAVLPTPKAVEAGGTEKPKKAPVGIIAAVATVVVAAGVAGFVVVGRQPAPDTPVAAVAPPAASPPTATAPPQQPAPPSTEPPKAEAPPTVRPPEAQTSAPVQPSPTPTPAVPSVESPVATTAPPAVPPPAAQPPAAPDMAVVRRQVETMISGLSCAGVRTADAGGNLLRLTGYVGREEDAQKLRALAGGLPEPVRLDSRVAVRPWPLCETLGVAGLPERAESLGANGIGLTLNSPSQRYRQGEKLVVTVKAGASGGHLTVDYIDLEGNAIHMMPMPLRRDGRVSSGQTVTLGVAATDKERDYTISPPFGAAMILAVVTRDPLFSADRAEVEPASAYLPKLRAALAAADKDGGVAVQSAFFTTVAD